MTFFAPEELSAFLDGELDPARMLAIGAMLEENAVARAQFEELARADSRWREAARSAAFPPIVRAFEANATGLPTRWASAAALLILVQLAVKIVGPVQLLLTFNSALLALVLIATPRLVAPALASERA